MGAANTVSPSVKWAVGLTVFAVTLAVLAEFPTTEPLAIGLGWAAALTVTVAYGEPALDEIQKVVK